MSQFYTGPTGHSMGFDHFENTAGWALVVLEHTHPIPWGSYGMQMFFLGYSERGPSQNINGVSHTGDMGWTERFQYSGTFFVIQDVDANNKWGFVYYGKAAQ